MPTPSTNAKLPARPPRHVGLITLFESLLLFAGMLVAYYVLPLDKPISDGAVATLIIGLVCVVLLLVWQIRQIVSARFPGLQAVKTFAMIVPLVLVLFSTTYYLLEHSTPHSFNDSLTRTDALYFTMTVFSTVGFGDIVAVTQTARVIVMIQMAVGLLLLGGAARLVVDAVRVGKSRQQPPGDSSATPDAADS